MSHNFVQRRRRPARPFTGEKGSRRAPARPPPLIAAPTPRYARRRRERPVGHEAEGTSDRVPGQPRKRAARRRHTHKARPPPPLSSHLSASRRRRMDSARFTPSKRRSRRWRDRAPRRHRREGTATHLQQTQVHAAFDVQDTEAWSNADDLRTPSEVKAELARLRQLALACVTAKMDNKKVNDKIDLNARARRPVAISLP